jgi:hypothetical protein
VITGSYLELAPENLYVAGKHSEDVHPAQSLMGPNTALSQYLKMFEFHCLQPVVADVRKSAPPLS